MTKAACLVLYHSKEFIQGNDCIGYLKTIANETSFALEIFAYSEFDYLDNPKWKEAFKTNAERSDLLVYINSQAFQRDSQLKALVESAKVININSSRFSIHKIEANQNDNGYGQLKKVFETINKREKPILTNPKPSKNHFFRAVILVTLIVTFLFYINIVNFSSKEGHYLSMDEQNLTLTSYKSIDDKKNSIEKKPIELPTQIDENEKLPASPISERELKSERSGSKIGEASQSRPPSEINIDPKEIKRKKIGKKQCFIWISPDGFKTTVTEKLFFDASDFYDPYAPVKFRKNGPFDIIDCFGKVVTHRIEDYKSIGEFHEGLAAVRDYENKFVGYINIHARRVIDFERIFPQEDFKEGSFFFDSRAYLFRQNGGYVQIDTLGRVLREFRPE